MGSLWYRTIRAQDVGTFHLQKSLGRTNLVLADADTVSKHGTDGRWQHETPYKEEFELLRHCTDMRFEGVPMRQAYHTGKSAGDCANYMENAR